MKRINSLLLIMVLVIVCGLLSRCISTTPSPKPLEALTPSFWDELGRSLGGISFEAYYFFPRGVVVVEPRSLNIDNIPTPPRFPELGSRTFVFVAKGIQKSLQRIQWMPCLVGVYDPSMEPEILILGGETWILLIDEESSVAPLDYWRVASKLRDHLRCPNDGIFPSLRQTSP